MVRINPRSSSKNGFLFGIDPMMLVSLFLYYYCEQKKACCNEISPFERSVFIFMVLILMESCHYIQHYGLEIPTHHIVLLVGGWNHIDAIRAPY